MNAPLIVAALVSLFTFADLASAELTPPRDLKQLVSDADTIVIGTVGELTDLGFASIEGAVGGSGARLVTGRITVHRVLKGASEGTIVFWSPVWRVALGLGQLAAKRDALIFLRQRDGNTEFVSPYYPLLNNVGFPSVTVSDPFEAAVQAIAAGLLGPKASAQMKREAIYALKGIDMLPAAQALGAVLQDRDRSVQVEAAAALLTINDLEGLAYAEAALMQPSSVAPGELLNLRVSLRGLKSPGAIRSLARLLARGDVATRREAASALGQIDSSDTLRPLGLALDDPDEGVRLSAVRALASATKQERGISLEGFRREQGRHIEEWKARLANLGINLP